MFGNRRTWLDFLIIIDSRWMIWQQWTAGWFGDRGALLNGLMLSIGHCWTAGWQKAMVSVVYETQLDLSYEGTWSYFSLMHSCIWYYAKVLTLMLTYSGRWEHALQRHSTENSKQIFPGKELRGYSPNSYIHVSVSDLYTPLIGLPILLQENRWA